MAPSLSGLRKLHLAGCPKITQKGLSHLLRDNASGITDLDSASSFVSDAVTFLDAQTGVTRYSYFMSADNYLLTSGSLNKVGNAYCN